MLKKIFLISMVVLLVLGLFSASLTLAQEPDDGAGKGEELRTDENSSEPAPQPHAPTFQGRPAESPAGKVPAVDLNNLTTPDGQTLPNPETLRAQALAFDNSLTPDQRAQIKAVLDANPPTYMDQVKAALGNPNPSVTADAPADNTVVQLTPDQLKAFDQAGRAWANQVNAGIRAVLTPEQASAFDVTRLPHPQDWAARLGIQAPGEITPQTSADCYYAYYYGYNYGNYYAYYAYEMAYYHYYYYGDPSAYHLLNLAYDEYVYSYYAFIYAYYAYVYYYDATYAFYAWYFADYASFLSYADWWLAYNLTYYWTGSPYAYYKYLYDYYGWYYEYYLADYYGYYCYAG